MDPAKSLDLGRVRPGQSKPAPMHADRQRLRQGLLEIALKWGQGRGRAGEAYGWLIDCRELLLQDDYLEIACRLLWQRIQPYQPQALAGFTLAAHPLALGLKFQSGALNLPVQLIRRTPKADGLQKQVEGPPLHPGQRVVLVDDLINSGETQRLALQALAPFHVHTPVVATLIDYQRGGSQTLRRRGIAVEALFTLAELGLQTPLQPPPRTPRWTFTGLNSGDYSAPKSSPRLSPDQLWIGSDQGFLLCLDRRGRELWRYPVRDQHRGIHATPLEKDGKLYFGAYDGYCTCLDSQTGRLLWETRPADWIGASPLLGDRYLYLGVEYGQRGGALMALDPTDGTPIWEARARHYVHSTPCLQGDAVLFAANDGVVRAHHAHSGQPLWKFYTQGPVQSPLSADSQRSYIASGDGLLYALHPDGRLAWSRRLSRRLYCKPLLVADLVLCGGDNSCLVALEAATGKVRWVHALAGTLIGGAALAPDGTIWAGSNRGQLWHISPTGQTLGGYAGPAPFRTIPSADAHGTLVCDTGGHLYDFAPAGGAPLP